MKKQITFLVIILAMGIIVAGCNKKQTPEAQIIEDNQVQSTPNDNLTLDSEEGKITGDTSEEIMFQLLKRENQNPEIYKIFDEIENPYNKNVKIVLFGLNKDIIGECCEYPTAIFINNNGVMVDDYTIMQGALNFLSFENAKWNNKKQISYDQVQRDEGGERKKNVVIDIE